MIDTSLPLSLPDSAAQFIGWLMLFIVAALYVGFSCITTRALWRNPARTRVHKLRQTATVWGIPFFGAMVIGAVVEHDRLWGHRGGAALAGAASLYQGGGDGGYAAGGHGYGGYGYGGYGGFGDGGCGHGGGGDGGGACGH